MALGVKVTLPGRACGAHFSLLLEAIAFPPDTSASQAPSSAAILGIPWDHTTWSSPLSPVTLFTSPSLHRPLFADFLRSVLHTAPAVKGTRGARTWLLQPHGATPRTQLAT